jgi:hypothetical protein
VNRALALLTVLAAVATLSAQTSTRSSSPPSQAPAVRGPRVGDTAPAFSLPDQNGVTRTLKSILGPNGAILVFFRSADW